MKFWVFELMVIFGLFHHLSRKEASGGSYRGKRAFFFFLRNRGKRAENERAERDGREDIILIYIILFYKYIILMSKRGK